MASPSYYKLRPEAQPAVGLMFCGVPCVAEVDRFTVRNVRRHQRWCRSASAPTGMAGIQPRLLATQRHESNDRRMCDSTLGLDDDALPHRLKLTVVFLRHLFTISKRQWCRRRNSADTARARQRGWAGVDCWCRRRKGAACQMCRRDCLLLAGFRAAIFTVQCRSKVI